MPVLFHGDLQPENVIIDKITIKKVCLVFVFFNTKNTSHEKQKTFITCLRVLDKENSKYLIKEKKNQISIHILKSFTLTKTLYY